MTLAVAALLLAFRPAAAIDILDLDKTYREGVQESNAGSLKKAEATFRDGLDQSESMHDDNSVIGFATQLAEVQEKLDDFEQACPHWWRCYELMQKHNLGLKADYYVVRFGECQLGRRPPDFELSEKYCGKARENLLAAHIEEGLVRVLACLARSKTMQGEWDLARFYRGEALDLFQNSPTGAPNRVHNLLALAQLYSAYSDDANAEQYIERARGQADQSKVMILTIEVEEATGELDLQRGRKAEGRREAEFALAERARSGLPMKPAQRLTAWASLVDGKPQEALDGFILAEDRPGKARAFLELKRFEEAQKEYRSLLASARASDEAHEAAIGLAKALEGEGLGRLAGVEYKKACKAVLTDMKKLDKKHREGFLKGYAGYFRREEACR